MNETQTGAATARRREYTWQDPRPPLALAAGLPGLEVIRRIADGRLPPPPLAATLELSDFEVDDEGCVSLRVTPAEFHYNPLGTVHGGVLATMLDTVAGCAVHTTLPAGVGYTSIDLHTRFVAPVRTGTGQVRCEGRVLHRGSRTATALARAEDTQGRLLAHATSTCLLFDAREAAAGTADGGAGSP